MGALLRSTTPAPAAEDVAEAEEIAQPPRMSSKPANVDGSNPPCGVTPAWPKRS